MRKRLLSALLAIAMVLALLPVSAFAADEGAWNGGVYEWYYTQLDTTQKKMYDYLKDELGSLEKVSTMIDGSKMRLQLSDEMRKITDKSKPSAADMVKWKQDFYLAYFALEWDHPEWPWLANIGFGLREGSLDNGPDPGAKTENGWLVWKENTWFIVTVEVPGAVSRGGEFNNKIEDAVSAISAEIVGDEENIELAKVIHDYLCQLVRYYPYSDGLGDVTAFGALLGYKPDGVESFENTAFSDGYAAAYKLLCDRFGVPCVRAVGDQGQKGSETNHGWNLVQLNGQWYGVDCALDDDDVGGAIADDFFAVGSGTVVGGSTFGAGHNVVAQWTKNNTDILSPAIPAMSAAGYDGGTEVPPPAGTATTTTLAVSGDPVTYGDNITLTATVTGGGAPVTTGTVCFLRNGDEGLGQVPVNSNGTATLTLNGKYPVGRSPSAPTLSRAGTTGWRAPPTR